MLCETRLFFLDIASGIFSNSIGDNPFAGGIKMPVLAKIQLYAAFGIFSQNGHEI
jgi:hypothetical protein